MRIDGHAGSFEVATDRLCAGFRENGVIRAGVLMAELEGSLATICASAVDDAKTLAASRRILVSHLTMLRNTGDVFADDTARQMFKCGHLPHLVRRGTARISLALENPAAYTVWAIRPNGERICRMPTKVEDGKLRFVADVARDRSEATMLYEVIR